MFASRGWFIYYADWEQRRSLRLGSRVWTAIARVGIHGLPAVERGVAMFHVTRANPTRAEERERARSPEYARLAERIASAGYRPLLADDEESSHYVKQFAPTATALHRERAAIDVLLGERRGRTLRPKRANAYVAAFREFARSDQWRSGGAGWSLHVEFPRGGSAALSVLLTQRDDGTFLGCRELRAEASVLIWPPKGREAEIERLAPTISAAGYRGGRGRAKSTKQGKPFPVFGDFTKQPIRADRLEAERRNLERLASELVRLGAVRSAKRLSRT